MDQHNHAPAGAAGRVDVRARPRVVIVGGGFGGVAAARALRRAPVDIVLIDRRNHQIFQPLLYQVATAVLAPGDIAAPLRQLAAVQPNVSVEMAEVTAIDTGARTLRALLPSAEWIDVDYDYLILAAGAGPSYFGHDAFAAFAPGLKTLSDADTIRSKILRAYELAELTQDPGEQQRLMTFVLVGSGPTGVELAATIAQMAQVTLRRNFKRIRPEQTKVMLLEGGARILSSFDPRLAEAAHAQLNRLGVEVRTGAVAETIDADGVVAGGERIRAATVLWTAGVAASPLTAMAGAETDRGGRARIGPNLETLDGSGVFVIGDAASAMQDAKPVPGVAQAALQQGAHAGAVIAARVAGGAPPPPFRYHDKGSMAVVGKGFALLEAPGCKLSGRLAWFVWAFIHIAFLPRLQNRLRVGVQWLWTYFTGQRGSRLIAEPSWALPNRPPQPLAGVARPIANGDADQRTNNA
ncbi:MAG TPA: NAD(P)/FAD-dependent oxidoreductase [Caulobacteraceae bacterium]|jgi:NADH dehydrogenase